MKAHVIIVAGGKGMRMGTETPKQFLPLNGKAIILHTLEKFSQALPQAELVLVLPESETDRWLELSEGTAFEKIRVAAGGENRFDSVKSGLSLISSEGVVAVHDAVRPFVSVEAVQRVFKEAITNGAAIPTVALKDSIREVKNEKSVSVDRNKYRLVQTPQCFHVNLLKEAYEQDYQDVFTDDASVVESFGKQITMVEGNQENMKITTPEDLRLAELLVKK